MTLKTDTLGWLLNAQVLLAMLGVALPKRIGRWVWGAVLPLGAAAILVRWGAVHHPPMRNLFEAFLWLPPARAFALECARCFDAARRSFAWGFFLISLALALGSIWGNEAWGAYWQWDPKEQWSLATWLVYAALWHVPASRPWRLTLLGVGLLAIILTVTWINLSKLFPGLHSYAGL